MSEAVKATERAERDRVRRPYCLACYAPIERTKRTSITCPRCDFVNVGADLSKYWTKEPKLRETEWLAKVVTGMFVGLVVFLMLRRIGMHFGMGQGYAVGFPIVVGVVLWETAGKITKRKPYFRATLFWMALPVVVALPFVFGVIWPDDTALEYRAMSAGVATALASFAFVPWAIGKRLGRWQEERILRGQRTAEE